MRKIWKNDHNNRSKTHQKTSKNTPKKHSENTTTQFQPKGRPKVTKKRPTREGKGGIQDGILLEKKRILQKPDLLRGKGACWKGYTQDTPNLNTLRGRAAPGPGANFSMFFCPLSARFWSMLGFCEAYQQSNFVFFLLALF